MVLARMLTLLDMSRDFRRSRPRPEFCEHGFLPFSFTFKQPPPPRTHFTLILSEVVEDLNADSSGFSRLQDLVREEPTLFYADEHVFCVYDAFPKSRFHLLILPRDLSLLRHSDLTPSHLPLLSHMTTVASHITSHLTSCDPLIDRLGLSFRVGFHAIPSLLHLHLHIISTDFSSPHLKRDPHWTSFTTDFLLDPQILVNKLTNEGKVEWTPDEIVAFREVKMANRLRLPLEFLREDVIVEDEEEVGEEFVSVRDVKRAWCRLNGWEELLGGLRGGRRH